MISVIIPIYNGEKYIERILNCLDKQTYKAFEVIFINDGSEDNSLERLKEYEANTKIDIKVINQINKGVSGARNAGLRNAKGEFICFCDVDDAVKESFLEDMLNVIIRHQVDLVFCKHEVIKGNRTINGNTRDGIVVLDKTICLRDFLYGRYSSGCCTMIVKRKILQENNLRFAEGYRYSEDIHMVWRVIACCEKIAYLNKVLYSYNIVDGSATSKFDENRFEGYQLVVKLEEFFKEREPKFYAEYKKYASNKILWSICWQAATNLEYKDFKKFIKKHNMSHHITQLITYKNLKVSISSFIFLLSPRLFRILSIKFGKKLIH